VRTDWIGLFAAAAVSFPAAVLNAGAPADEAAPGYTDSGQLKFPANFRTWVYLTTGFNMSYVATSSNSDTFDNVFVNPTAYAAFLATGTWPDKTVLVLEARRGVPKSSIDRTGASQGGRVGLEVHVKDVGRFKGGWAFFDFAGDGPGQLLPQTLSCYTCHAEHAAVDTTFVQFYPTLKPIAAQHHTLSAAYLADEAVAHLGAAH